MEQLPLHSLLDEAIEAWSNVRHGLIAEVDNIPADKLEYRPDENVRSARELVLHIMESNLMMVGELVRNDTDFTRMPFPELVDQYAASVQGVESKKELLDSLEDTLVQGIAKFRNVGELHMLQTITRFDGREGTRLAWFNHGIDHEMYHRGQLTVYARMMGLVPALTKRIHGDAGT